MAQGKRTKPTTWSNHKSKNQQRQQAPVTKNAVAVDEAKQPPLKKTEEDDDGLGLIDKVAINLLVITLLRASKTANYIGEGLKHLGKHILLGYIIPVPFVLVGAQLLAHGFKDQNIIFANNNRMAFITTTLCCASLASITVPSIREIMEGSNTTAQDDNHPLNPAIRRTFKASGTIIRHFITAGWKAIVFTISIIYAVIRHLITAPWKMIVFIISIVCAVIRHLITAPWKMIIFTISIVCAVICHLITTMASFTIIRKLITASGTAIICIIRAPYTAMQRYKASKKKKAGALISNCGCIHCSPNAPSEHSQTSNAPVNGPSQRSLPPWEDTASTISHLWAMAGAGNDSLVNHNQN